MAPIINVSNSANWQQIFNTTLTAQPLGLTTGNKFHPIPAFSVPVELDSHFLVVEAGSTFAKPNWNLAFYVSQRFGVEGVRLVECSSQAVRLGSNLIRFPTLTDTYTLRCRIPYWHREMDITVWKYTGVTLDTNDLVGDSLIQLARIEAKVDEIAFSVNP